MAVALPFEYECPDCGNKVCADDVLPQSMGTKRHAVGGGPVYCRHLDRKRVRLVEMRRRDPIATALAMRAGG